MKAAKNEKKGSDSGVKVMLDLYKEHLLSKEDDKKREKKALVDKFNLHLKGKVIILENRSQA